MKILRNERGEFLSFPTSPNCVFPYTHDPLAVWVDLEDFPVEVTKFLLSIGYTQDNIDTLLAPKTPTPLSKFEFLQRFTQQERISARALRDTDPLVEDFFDLFEMSEYVDLKDPHVYEFVTYLVGKGILIPDRVQSILR